MSERPVHRRPRRLVDWLKPTGAKKVHSLVDKVYQRKNLEIAWEQVRANRGSGGVDGQNLEDFAAQLDQQLDRLHTELRAEHLSAATGAASADPKAGQTGGVSSVGHTDHL